MGNPRQGIRVKAITLQGEGRVVGYYDLRRIREGEEFTISDEKHFSKRWMVRLDKDPVAQPARAGGGKFAKAEPSGRREMDADDRI